MFLHVFFFQSVELALGQFTYRQPPTFGGEIGGLTREEGRALHEKTLRFVTQPQSIFPALSLLLIGLGSLPA